MLKYAIFFIAGAITATVALLVYVRFSAERSVNELTATTKAVTAVVTIRVSQDPQVLSPVKNASELLDRITGVPDSEKKKIREALASGLITEIRVEGNVGGESRWISIPATSSGAVLRGSSKATFGPALLNLESVKKPNKAPEPTPGSVTPRATEGTSK